LERAGQVRSLCPFIILQCEEKYTPFASLACVWEGLKEAGAGRAAAWGSSQLGRAEGMGAGASMRG